MPHALKLCDGQVDGDPPQLSSQQCTAFFSQHAHFEDRAVQAARLSLVQVLINSKGLQMNPLQSLYYVSPACLLCLSVPFGKRSPDFYLGNNVLPSLD